MDETVFELGPHDAALIIRDGEDEPEFIIPDYGAREVVPDDVIVLSMAFAAILDKHKPSTELNVNIYALLRGMAADVIHGRDIE